MNVYITQQADQYPKSLMFLLTLQHIFAGHDLEKLQTPNTQEFDTEKSATGEMGVGDDAEILGTSLLSLMKPEIQWEKGNPRLC